FSQSTCLIKCDCIKYTDFFKADTAFDKYTFLRRITNRRYNRNRCGDDKCARTADDKDSEALIDPCAPFSSEEQRRHDNNKCCHCHDGRCIVLREFIDECLCRRTFAL